MFEWLCSFHLVTAHGGWLHRATVFQNVKQILPMGIEAACYSRAKTPRETKWFLLIYVCQLDEVSNSEGSSEEKDRMIFTLPLFSLWIPLVISRLNLFSCLLTPEGKRQGIRLAAQGKGWGSGGQISVPAQSLRPGRKRSISPFPLPDL